MNFELRGDELGKILGSRNQKIYWQKTRSSFFFTSPIKVLTMVLRVTDGNFAAAYTAL